MAAGASSSSRRRRSRTSRRRSCRERSPPRSSSHLYLERIKAYNGTCVNEPEGILGPISTIPNAGKLNALITLNLRPAGARRLGLRRAQGAQHDRRRSTTTRRCRTRSRSPPQLDAQVRARPGKLVGPLHGVVMAIKDQYDTFDMRTTSGADAFWANDRPPDDATFVKRLRDAGAIILAKANMGEYAAGGVTGTRSSFGGTMCNAYDTERDPGASSGGSGMAVAANFVTCAIGEETGTLGARAGQEQQRRRPRADARAGQRRRHDPAGLTTRVGPICRTVEDAARILDAYAGFDPEDELTAFSVGRKPPKPYYELREGEAARRLPDRRRARVHGQGAVHDRRRARASTSSTRRSTSCEALGATIVDPGEGGALFQGCVDKYWPVWHNRCFIGQFPAVFPVDAAGARPPTTSRR